MKAVTAEAVSRRFGAVTALDSVDLEIPAGTVLGLLGHNGAGKTTMVRILTTLLKPSSGRAAICGHDVEREPERVRQSLALAGQQATLDELLSGTENLVLLGMLLGLSRKAAKQRAGELLERFGLTEAGKRVVGTYSGGMRRRLDLAACLLVPRPVVLLDEPTTGLDPASRLEVHEAIRELVDEGTALLLTTQYLEEADKLADRIVVLARGRVVAQGTPGQMKDAVGGRRVEAIIGDGEDLHAAAQALNDAGYEPAIDDRTRTVSAPAPDGTDDLTRAVNALSAFTVLEAALRRPTLDDAFLQLAGEADGPEAAEEAVATR
jgi:ABC-2 type transport system ATP-binding protein